MIPGQPASLQSSEDHDIVQPSAAALIESLRALGYTLQAAVADLVDNSISAGASHIDVTAHWTGERSWITILDDGRGMTPDELVNAMRAGSASPLAERRKGDLGRFGMGLKTASFSQCRRLTVASRTAGGPITVRQWDLDHVAATGQWQLLRRPASGSESLLQPLETLEHGTLVLWEVPDRITGRIPPGEVAAKKARRQFHEALRRLEDHLATTFHRFLHGPRRRTLTLNGNVVAPWDPLLGGWEATAQLPEEQLHLDGHAIRVQGTVLPHPSRIEAGREEEAAGPAGWNQQQGFHVYRDNRLLSAGGWLGLGLEQDDRYRLARVRIDLPATLDRQWGVDIRKSRVSIPPALRDDLRRIAKLTRDHALNVYRQRSGAAPRAQKGEPVSLWLIAPDAARQRYTYRINRDHPLVDLARQASPEQQKAVDLLLELISRTLPVERIWMNGPVTQAPPGSTMSPEDVSRARRILTSLVASGLSPAQASLRLGLMEPYCDLSSDEFETLLSEEHP